MFLGDAIRKLYNVASVMEKTIIVLLYLFYDRCHTNCIIWQLLTIADYTHPSHIISFMSKIALHNCQMTQWKTKLMHWLV